MYDHLLIQNDYITSILNFSRILIIILLYSVVSVNFQVPGNILAMLTHVMEFDDIKADEKLYFELGCIVSELNLNKNGDETNTKNAKIGLSNDLDLTHPVIIVNYLEIPNIDSWNFNIFSLKAETLNSELIAIMIYFFNRYNFNQLGFHLPEYTNFFLEIQAGNSKNPYHNSTHASDVAQCLHFLLYSCDLSVKLDLSLDYKTLSFISTGIHDFKHPGLSNNFLIKSKHKLARRYNDKAILENYHISCAFKLIYSNPNADLFTGIDANRQKFYRKIIIELILATDFSRHSEDFLKAQKITDKEIIDEGEKIVLLASIIHTCDISNPSRP